MCKRGFEKMFHNFILKRKKLKNFFSFQNERGFKTYKKHKVLHICLLSWDSQITFIAFFINKFPEKC